LTSTVGDRLTDETAELEVIGRPYMTNMGKLDVTEIRTLSAHERVSVMRT
jgi:hypothetical protein